LFSPSRAVRPQRSGEATVYVADAQARSPTHWVVDAREAKDVDPELSRLASLAANLFP
jgi:hypothetical protein